MRIADVDVYALTGARLSERIAAVWPQLPESERDRYRTMTTEDDCRALLAEHEERYT